MGLKASRTRLSLVTFAVLLWSMATSSYARYEDLDDSFHPDGRPKVLIFPPFASELKGEELAKAYLDSQVKLFIGGETNDSILKLRKSNKSLLGTHYYYQHIRNDIEIENSEVIVSLTPRNVIYLVYNALKSSQELGTPRSAKTLISESAATQKAWEHLRVHGELLSLPKAKLLFALDKSKNQVYKISINTVAPQGTWLVYVDASSGKILSSQDQRITRFKRAVSPSLENYHGPIINRENAIRTYKNKFQREHADELLTKTNGTGLIFEVDPRTALRSDDIHNDSIAHMFDAAYVTKPLKDISFDGEFYRLEGPWVKITDFTSPTAAPSKSKDGKWLAKRGDNSFNDAMVYFQIDQSQRYIQSLGFTQDHGIQNTALPADSYGTDDDNSYYDPENNRIAFGHGCVPDTEDSAVILHEYGHALQFSVYNNWSDGDTGAIGEGFGDYWAASYASSTSNGDHNINRVFKWDASDPNCWPGRIVNRLEAVYDHEKHYRAHGSDGDYPYDELWSTPLFQGLLKLGEKGVAREDVDRVVLQSHYGLGYGTKMRDLAKSTLLAAKLLYAQGIHAEELRRQFEHHRIL